VIGGEVKRISEAGSGKLGFAFGLGLVTALWSTNAGMKALFDALNVAYEEVETRGFIALNALSLLFTVATVGFISLSLGAMIVVPIVLTKLNLDFSWAGTLLSLLRWPVLLALIGVGLALLYRFGPAHKKPSWKWITPGSLFAALTWVAASLGFSYYAEHFGNYNKTYGTLGAAIGLMIWLWISAIVIMVGAELNAETAEKPG
jgi:membrane protein